MDLVDRELFVPSKGDGMGMSVKLFQTNRKAGKGTPHVRPMELTVNQDRNRPGHTGAPQQKTVMSQRHGCV